MVDNARLTALLGVNVVLLLGTLTLGYVNFAKVSELSPNVRTVTKTVVVTPTATPSATPSATPVKTLYPTARPLTK